METRPFNETDEWKLGDESQKQWMRLLAHHEGRSAMPAYDVASISSATKAPLLLTKCGSLIVPDVLVFGNPDEWHEVKGKTEPTWRRTHARWEHGIDWSLIKEYQRVQSVTGKPVVIIVHEHKSPSDDNRAGELLESDLWLRITLNTATQAGEHRPTWPGGYFDPYRRGRYGQGGLLWARNQMEIAIDNRGLLPPVNFSELLGSV